MQQMCELSQGVWIVYLTCLSLIDIRTRKIPIWLLGAGGVMAIVMQIWKSLKDFSNPYCVGCSCGNCISRN